MGREQRRLDRVLAERVKHGARSQGIAPDASLTEAHRIATEGWPRQEGSDMKPFGGRRGRLSILAGAAVTLALPFGGASQAATASDGPMAAVRAFVADFDKGDIAGAQATNADDVSIIDEFPPHAWHAPGAFQGWLGALGAEAKAKDQSDQKVTVGRATRTRIDGDTAYLVVSVVYTYKEHGQRMAEPAQMDVALKNGDGGWKIASWAWVGTTPRRAAAAAKPAPAPPKKP